MNSLLEAPSLITRLAILQQSEYEWPRYQQWLGRQRTAGVVSVEPKKWTLKLRALFWFGHLLSPVLGVDNALGLGIFFLSFPQHFSIWLLCSLATLRLRSLQRNGLVVIAVAGSYAKTTTKSILAHSLAGVQAVCVTPENINTPIGIARVIIQKLRRSQRIFVVELGEYTTGDLAKLVRFVRPEIAILTPVGFAHLERFGSNESLERGLLEIFTTLPIKTRIAHKANASILSRHGIDADYWYGPEMIEHVTVTRAGTEFSYRGQSIFLPLFGVHNAVNTLPLFCVADALSIDTIEVLRRLPSLPPIPHRLEPTVLEGNILLLDNGYNANPASSQASLEVLSVIEGTTKIVCTPGFVELGEDQDRYNKDFGTAIANVADVCVVIRGVNTEPLLSGLSAAKKDIRIILADNEIDGMQQLRGELVPGSVVLFENSIPALYQ